MVTQNNKNRCFIIICLYISLAIIYSVVQYYHQKICTSNIFKLLLFNDSFICTTLKNIIGFIEYISFLKKHNIITYISKQYGNINYHGFH